MSITPPDKIDSSIHHDEMSEKELGVNYLSADPNEDPDVALKVLAAYTHEGPITKAEERALLRKIDWLLMPLVSHLEMEGSGTARSLTFGFQMLSTYGLAYLDKAVFSTSALFGMVQ